MSILNYPTFVDGQTLTQQDLNDTRDYLSERDRRIARTVGFGIAAGLQGSVDAAGLTISAGLAIDQAGEVLMLSKDELIAVPPVPDVGAFDFISGADGFTVVAVRTDAPKSSPPCTQAGCIRHSEQHETGLDLLVVRGRLATGAAEFSKEPLLTDVSPLTVTANGNVTDAFVALRNAIVNRIGPRLKSELTDKLASMKLESSDLPVVKAYKAGFLNQVLFATLDLLRFESLMSTVAIRDTAKPGVALGWLHQTGGTWEWDCSFRHEWDPPTGLTLALVGGSCSDPGRPWLQRLEMLIDTFELPPIPAPNDPPKNPGPVRVCKKYGQFFDPDCHIVVFPPPKLDPDWYEPWLEPQDPFVFPPPWFDPIPDTHVYHIDPADTLDVGVIDLLATFGAKVDDAKTVVADAVVNQGLSPAVDVAHISTVQTIEGFQHSGAAGAGDRIVLLHDDMGKIVATGRIPAAQMTRDLTTALPAAVADASTAHTLATGLKTDVDGLQQSFDGMTVTIGKFSDDIDGLQQFQGHVTNWQTGVDTQLTGLDGRIKTYADSRFSQLQTDLASQLPGLVDSSLGQIRSELVETTKLAQNMAGQVDMANKQLLQINGRVDGLFRATPRVLTATDTDVNRSLIDIVKTMRTTIEDVAPDDQREATKTRLAAVDDALVRLEAADASGASVLADSPETLTSVVDGLVDGLRLAGVPASNIRALRRQSTVLRTALGNR